MRVFICWSGDRSKAIAESLKKLLSATLPALAPASSKDPIFLSKDIEKGSEWFQSVRAGLDTAEAGIVVLTHENSRNPWIHFEAGALARTLSATPTVDESSGADGAATGFRDTAPPAALATMVLGTVQNRSRSASARPPLFPLLHRVTTADLTGPLAAYQATNTTREDMGRLIIALADLLRVQRPVQDRKGFFIAEEHWREFEETLEDAAIPLAALLGDLRRMFQRKTFDEPLHACADQQWLARYEGAKVTLDRLREHRSLVAAACAPHEQGLFDMLLSDLDRYAMSIQALLITPKRFPLGPKGELQMDAGTQTCCESRRLGIKSVSTRLLHPLDTPMTTAAVRFMAAETDEERKAIVHRIEGRIRWQRERAYEDASKGEPRANADRDAIGRLLKDSARGAGGATQEVTPDSEPLLRGPSPDRLMTCRASSWDLDRILYYRVVYYFESAAFRWPELAAGATPDVLAAPMEHDLFCAVRDVEMECEKFRARTKGGSLMPLTYALLALKGLHPHTATNSAKVQASIASVGSVVREELGELLLSEAGRPIATLLTNLW